MCTANMAQDGRRPPEDVASSCVTPNRDRVRYVAIGRIVAPHGVRGELRVDIESEEPERFRDLGRVYVSEEHAPYSVRGARLHDRQALLSLVGIDDRDAAEALRGMWVYVSVEDALPLADGEYYYFQIVGLEAIAEGGESLGRVTQVFATGSNDVYVISGARGEMLLPALDDVILHIDLPNGRMTVRIPEGLL